MHLSYGLSERGAYHINKGVVCQDSHKIVDCGENMIIAAVADGVGSEKYSDIASKIAVGSTVSYCKKTITPKTSPKSILKHMHDSFLCAKNNIEKSAGRKNRPITEYDTTLSLVVFIDEDIYYGHVGDSGIIAATKSGEYKLITETQRDGYGRVFPLCYEEKWEFGKFNEPACGAFLATDGMLELFFPIYIREDKINIHVALAEFFMRPDIFKKLGQENMKKRIKEYIQSLDKTIVYDDKTVVYLLNTEVITKRREDEYYKEPDWELARKKYEDAWRRKAYPSLHSSEQEKNKYRKENGSKGDRGFDPENLQGPSLLQYFRFKIFKKF